MRKNAHKVSFIAFQTLFIRALFQEAAELLYLHLFMSSLWFLLKR